jgi:hypothetical protein
VIRLAVLLLGAAVVFSGCGSSSKSSSGSGCEDVPVSLNNEVASSLATGFSVDGFQAVRSSDNKDVWFVSGHATYPDGSVHYPVWATKNLSSGPVYVVDQVSRNVTEGLNKLQDAPSDQTAMTDAKKCAQEANTSQ